MQNQLQKDLDTLLFTDSKAFLTVVSLKRFALFKKEGKNDSIHLLSF